MLRSLALQGDVARALVGRGGGDASALAAPANLYYLSNDYRTSIRKRASKLQYNPVYTVVSYLHFGLKFHSKQQLTTNAGSVHGSVSQGMVGGGGTSPMRDARKHCTAPHKQPLLLRSQRYSVPPLRACLGGGGGGGG